MKSALRAIVGPLIILGVLIAALWLLHDSLREYHLRDFVNGISAIGAGSLWLAVGLTCLNYLILIGYDLIGVTYIGQSLSLAKVALASFLGYAVGNNFGTLFGGSTVRYRLYSSWGLSAIDIVRLVFILSITFWIGVFALAGFIFAWDPIPLPEQLHLSSATTRPLGIILSLVATSYLILCSAVRHPLHIGKWELALPGWRLALLQYVVSALDLIVAATVLFVLLPSSVQVEYVHFLAAYLLAIVAVFLSQVPGGLGVLELVILAVLKPDEPQAVMGSLLAYRLIYYLSPLALGLVALGINEIAAHGRLAKKTVALLGHWNRVIAPRLLAFGVFVSGTVLLLSGATPPAAGRMEWARRLLPLPVMEFSHFLGSIIGVLLLILARGLQRRIETAYYATIALLGSGIVASLLKGFDYEEALILAAMLVLFLPSHPHFYRKGALLTERFTPQWLVGIALTLACTVWLMLFAYKHVEYQHDLWWRFAFQAHAPRSMRALVGAVCVALAMTSYRMLRSQAQLGNLPTPSDLEDARTIVGRSPCTVGNLALLGDKRFLFNEARTAFVMYGVEGNSYISMGDPIGSEDAIRELAWDFWELCDLGGHWSVFYQIDEAYLSTYVEIGLTMIKIGEEARVPLANFGLEGSARKSLRHTHHQVTLEGCSFEVIWPPDVVEILPALKPISDAWLSSKHAAEKGFSLGFFKPDYIARCPVAVVRKNNKLIAFANLWLGANKEELSLDLMRYLPGASHGVMDYLFIQLMLWGKQNGYQWFNLGMAPLAGIEGQRRGPLWNQIAGLTFRHGEHFYNFQGLRQYKDKFGPTWTAKYIASPGGLSLPVILTNVTTIISGGVKGLFSR